MSEQRWKHGTVSGYQNHGCRCDECKLAARLHSQQQHRARMEAKAVPVQALPGEKWRPVHGNPTYRVSSHGRVMRVGGTGRGRPYDRLLTNRIGTTGYHMVTMVPPGGKPRTVRVHRLMVEAFIRPMTDAEVVNHLDGVKTNNALVNLEITDRRGNLAHAMRTGLIRTGIEHGMAKLTDEQVREIRAAFDAGEQAAPIAARYGIGRAYAYQLKYRNERPNA